VYETDAMGNFITQTTDNIQSGEMPILSSLQLIGVNEPVNYQTINRNFQILNNNLNAVRDALSVRYYIVTSSEIVWTWDYHRINGPQFNSQLKNPFTWKELTKNYSILNSGISGITWDNISFVSPGIDNYFPICWKWDQMCCQCIFPVSWDQIVPGTRYTKTWEDLEDNCCMQPRQIFDDCYNLC
jgi:hypothetical protein